MNLTYYHFGHTSLFASQYDQRFSYCLYVPSSYREGGEDIYPLTVVVHGTERGAQRYRDEFADFGEEHQSIILAPLFPCGIDQPGELNNYKFIDYHGIRFDRILLAMLDEVAALYRLAADRFLLHGFSGGGHFAHRFYYLHPHRLSAVSIGAPGLVTLLDPDRDWWVGTRGMEQRFDRTLDLDEMRRVPVQMVIGGEDTDTWEITLSESDDLWMDGGNDAGVTRLDRLASLKHSFIRAGIDVRYDIVPGVGHEGFDILEPVKEFLATELRRERATGEI